ncbi:MAG: flagellar hook-length control protein FliK [Cellvibrio sp.]|uniref:flagellar hook-length control protein FliK n=1 Tax=Cellvibrio sp. TaxID=1965322 RepID=UPI0031B00F95
MNNGNLLNALMGATGANTAAAKTTAAKTRAETGEKFQQALEQARPEVAARKPVARKEAPPAERPDTARPAAKAASQKVSRQESPTDELKKSSTEDSKAVDAGVKSASPLRNAKADKQPVDDADRESSEDATVIQCAVPQALTDTPIESLDLTIPLSEEDDEVLSDFSGEITNSPLNLDNLVELSDNTLQVSDEENQESVDLTNVDPLLQDASLLAGNSPQAQSDLPEDESVELSPLVAPAQAQIGLGQIAAGLSAKTQPTTQTPAVQLISEGLIGNGLDDLSVDTAAASVTPEEGEATVDIDVGENPDFLLLNSKAALNKLTETNLTTSNLDKATPAPELAKASPVGALVESLGRLTEAQSPAARAFVVQTGVPVTVGTPQWSQAVGDKVLWLAAQNVSSAEIRLDPPELGPMQVKVSVNQDQANITFTSPHPVVRDALDQQLNRLREMFSEQGLNLVNVDVSDKSFAQQEREQGEANKGQANLDVDDEELAPVAMTQAISMRLVDHYA